MTKTSEKKLPVAVIGDGWAATALVTFLATPSSSEESPRQVLWFTGTGARAASPLPVLEAGVSSEAFQRMLERLGIESEAPQMGMFVREFRSKSFARPAWIKAPTREDRHHVMQEMLWGPETRFFPQFETRTAVPMHELEDLIRAKLLEIPHVRRISGVPIRGFDSQETPTVILGSGETFAVEHVYYADRWTSLAGLEGLPKGASLVRNREPMGILQATFTHSCALVSSEMKEGFFGQTHKDPGDEITRNVLGYFFDSGKRSVWSIFLAPEESEDNHAIAKKLRRLKQALDRMFVGPEWLPEGTTAFLDTVKDEQVRFEETFVLSEGNTPAEAVQLPKLPFITFFTDGFGPSFAYESVGRSMGEILIPETRTETLEAPSA